MRIFNRVLSSYGVVKSRLPLTRRKMGEENFSTCLLYDPSNYYCDTINLSQDHIAKDYWFDCIQDLVKVFANQAAKSQKNDPTSKTRSEQFHQDYIESLNNLKIDANCTGPVTIRQLLELNEPLLRKYGFADPWLEQKLIENENSIRNFKSRLDQIDCLGTEDKWIELVKGLLAGNIFDWGAQTVSEILENDKSFGLNEALAKIQSRPWLIDDLDAWVRRINNGPSHKCAIIFVDNSGVDVVLGILPFARELLKRRTKVIMCANSEPSLNDVTAQELENILESCCQHCVIIDAALREKQLLVYGNGQKGPCLDMRNLPADLCEAIRTNDVDLLIIEGMGRALHTNLNAKFTCETLKLAVIKNTWLANRLGGDIFSVICKYEIV
ncbi:4'-phosphopantetheine phosphatase [Condylostylus longicornis]|uniref:4'-phosphopantetheine phosphatase n=1 Tax=Condylostylus longicornis TaxID=2530218 RepID=UPI00244DB61E|nr:4'-phosphopantetheine phosphatase [Condylostylus longicornis]